MHELYFGKSALEDRVMLKGRNLNRLQAILVRLGDLKSPAASLEDPAVRAALDAFLGRENFEERANISEGWLDRPVLKYLLKKFENPDAG
jgi:hypothetical protein